MPPLRLLSARQRGLPAVPAHHRGGNASRLARRKRGHHGAMCPKPLWLPRRVHRGRRPPSPAPASLSRGGRRRPSPPRGAGPCSGAGRVCPRRGRSEETPGEAGFSPAPPSAGASFVPEDVASVDEPRAAPSSRLRPLGKGAETELPLLRGGRGRARGSRGQRSLLRAPRAAARRRRPTRARVCTAHAEADACPWTREGTRPQEPRLGGKEPQSSQAAVGAGGDPSAKGGPGPVLVFPVPGGPAWTSRTGRLLLAETLLRPREPRPPRMAAPGGCALAEEPPGRPTRARLLAGAALPSLREAHTLGTVPLLFRQRRALACGAESRGDWASLGPGGARPAPRDWQAGLSRLLFVSDAPLQ